MPHQNILGLMEEKKKQNQTGSSVSVIVTAVNDQMHNAKERLKVKGESWISFRRWLLTGFPVDEWQCGSRHKMTLPLWRMWVANMERVLFGKVSLRLHKFKLFSRFAFEQIQLFLSLVRISLLGLLIMFTRMEWQLFSSRETFELV